MITDPNTGEIIESPAQAKELWRQATEHEKEAKRLKDSLKPYVSKLIEDNSGNPVEFADGQRFVEVNSQSFVIPPTLAYGIVEDIDQFMELLKPDAVDMKLIPEDLVSDLMAHKVPFRAKSYVKLEKTKFDEAGD